VGGDDDAGLLIEFADQVEQQGVAASDRPEQATHHPQQA
jgi:hypothetical protein